MNEKNQTFPTIEPKVVNTTQAEVEARARQLASLAKNESHPENYIGLATSQVIEQKYGKKK